MVHASLRRIGLARTDFGEGGADLLLDALEAAVGPAGTLMMVLGTDYEMDWVYEHPPGARAALARRRAGLRLCECAGPARGRLARRGVPAAGGDSDQRQSERPVRRARPPRRGADGGPALARLLRARLAARQALPMGRADPAPGREPGHRHRAPPRRISGRRGGQEKGALGLCRGRRDGAPRHVWVDCLDDLDGIVDWPGEDYFASILRPIWRRAGIARGGSAKRRAS